MEGNCMNCKNWCGCKEDTPEAACLVTKETMEFDDGCDKFEEKD